MQICESMKHFGQYSMGSDSKRIPVQICSTKFGEILCKPLPLWRSSHQKLIVFRSYREDFLKQYSQYESQREIFLRAPSSATDAGIISLRDLIDFTSHVADCYPDITRSFPEELSQILTLHHKDLEPELREKIVGSLVLLRRKDIIDSSVYAGITSTYGSNCRLLTRTLLDF